MLCGRKWRGDDSTGFTGHHQLDAHNLVHMGGRVYDPALGRFLSADILVQAPYDTQSFNRYSYVLNNPLSLNDPSGYCSGAPDTFSQIMRDQMEANIEAAHISFTIDTMIRINNQIIATATKKGTLHKVGLLKTGKGARKNASAKVRFVKEANEELKGSGLTVNEDATAILDSSGNIVGILELDLASGSVASLRLNSGYELVNSPAGEMTKQKGISWGGSENGCLLAGWSCSGEFRYGGDTPELVITARPSALGNMINAVDLISSINPYKLLTKVAMKWGNRKSVTVLGENMTDRVIPYANKTGARYLPFGTTAEKWSMLSPKQKWKLNDGALRKRIKEGDSFEYIGQDAYRDPLVRRKFDLTRSELLRLNERGVKYDTVAPSTIRNVIKRQ
jgi:RHS repeat-associated protein